MGGILTRWKSLVRIQCRPFLNFYKQQVATDFGSTFLVAIRLLSEFWDLKTLAFQAKTSSTLDPFIIGRGSGDRGEPETPWESTCLRPVFLQSGFQPTVEPTGFQPVVVQFVARPMYLQRRIRTI